MGLVVRNQTLKFFQAVTIKFVRTVLEKKGFPPAVLDAAGGKVFTYGSYRLGVYGPGWFISSQTGVLFLSCRVRLTQLGRLGYRYADSGSEKC